MQLPERKRLTDGEALDEKCLGGDGQAGGKVHELYPPPRQRFSTI